MTTALWTIAVIYGLSLAVVMPTIIREVTRREDDR